MIGRLIKVGKDIAVGVASGAAYEAAKWGCERGREALWQLKNRKWNHIKRFKYNKFFRRYIF